MYDLWVVLFFVGIALLMFGVALWGLTSPTTSVFHGEEGTYIFTGVVCLIIAAFLYWVADGKGP
jgi:predicted small integral membrane protein